MKKVDDKIETGYCVSVERIYHICEATKKYFELLRKYKNTKSQAKKLEYQQLLTESKKEIYR